MDPAQTIVTRLGGPSKVAAAIGIHRTRVSNWTRPSDRGGTGGAIPVKHWAALIKFAEEQGVLLTPADLFAASDEAKSPEAA